jgi:hypothetical protein
MAFVSLKGLAVWFTARGAGLAEVRAMALASVKGLSLSKLSFRPRKLSAELALPFRRAMLARRRWASRSSSPSSMLRSVKKSGWPLSAGLLSCRTGRLRS